MMRASDFRETAWNILRGRYWWTVLAALIAIFLGGCAGQPPVAFHFNISVGPFAQNAQHATYWPLSAGVIRMLTLPFVGLAAGLGSIALVYAIAIFIVGSAVELGYDLFNLSLYETYGTPKIETLFSRFPMLGNALVLRLLMALKILLWSLLLIVPGIIAAYRYAMAPYLLAEHPDLTATEAIEQSKQLMDGHKARLFCLHLSFIGWYLLAALTGGIGYFFLAPYVKAAETGFYLDRTGRPPMSVAIDREQNESSGREYI